MGLESSDLVLTVSPRYAYELLQGGLEACSLSGEIQATAIKGIRNGIDVDVWNPQNDKLLPENMRYSLNNVQEGKQKAKAILQERLGLDVSSTAPLFGFIGRLDPQKGVDLLMAATSGFLKGPSIPNPLELQSKGIQDTDQIQLAALGTGENYLEEALKGLQHNFPGAAIGFAEFNEPIAHQLLAGCDYLLVPSRYEPCGQVAMCALRYGCIPIVSPVGGLVELVLRDGVGVLIQSSPHTSTSREFVLDLIQTVKEVAHDYGSTGFKQMRDACMRADVSWDGPAREWEAALLGLSDQEKS